MPNFQMINGIFYSFCHNCGAKVKGEEKLKLGNAGNQGRKDVHFYCSRCQKSWHIDKVRLISIIKVGFRNAHGDWIHVDEKGRPLPQDLEKIRQKRIKEQIKCECCGKTYRKEWFKTINGFNICIIMCAFNPTVVKAAEEGTLVRQF